MATGIIKIQSSNLKSVSFSETSNVAGAITTLGKDINSIVMIGARSDTPTNTRLFPFLLSDGKWCLQCYEYANGTYHVLTNTNISGTYYYTDI